MNNSKTQTQTQTQTPNITELERIFIEDYKVDNFVCDFGWDHPDAEAWVDCYSDECRLSSKQLSGVFSSLKKKGIIRTNGESFGLTDKGREVAGKI